MPYEKTQQGESPLGVRKKVFSLAYLTASNLILGLPPSRIGRPTYSALWPMVYLLLQLKMLPGGHPGALSRKTLSGIRKCFCFNPPAPHPAHKVVKYLVGRPGISTLILPLLLDFGVVNFSACFYDEILKRTGPILAHSAR